MSPPSPRQAPPAPSKPSSLAAHESPHLYLDSQYAHCSLPLHLVRLERDFSRPRAPWFSRTRRRRRHLLVRRLPHPPLSSASTHHPSRTTRTHHLRVLPARARVA